MKQTVEIFHFYLYLAQAAAQIVCASRKRGFFLFISPRYFKLSGGHINLFEQQGNHVPKHQTPKTPTWRKVLISFGKRSTTLKPVRNVYETHTHTYKVKRYLFAMLIVCVLHTYKLANFLSTLKSSPGPIKGYFPEGSGSCYSRIIKGRCRSSRIAYVGAQ